MLKKRYSNLLIISKNFLNDTFALLVVNKHRLEIHFIVPT